MQASTSYHHNDDHHIITSVAAASLNDDLAKKTSVDLSQLFQSDIHWNDATGSLVSGRHRNSQYSNTLSPTGRPLLQHLRTHGR